jgi:DNA-binding NtrC family response regulator
MTMNNRAEVLVLDDEVIVCDRLKEFLEKSDFSVETFTDSRAAMERLAEKRFDVLVTDLKMKGPNGLDVMQFVHRQGQGTQVIIITGYSSMEAVREAEYSGVFGFLDKPFQMGALAKLVKKAAAKSGRVQKALEK